MVKRYAEIRVLQVFVAAYTIVKRQEKDKLENESNILRSGQKLPAGARHRLL